MKNKAKGKEQKEKNKSLTMFIKIVISCLLLIILVISMKNSEILIYSGLILVLSSVLILGMFFIKYIKIFLEKTSKNKWSKCLMRCIIALCILGIITPVVLTFQMSNAMLKQPNGELTVIVLGCGINEKNPSLMLSLRLKEAKKYLEQNTNAICIVSGGQGADEIVPESEVMKKWLVTNGIDENRVIEENTSTSTYTNIKNSTRIIEEYGLDKNVVVVSDAFHQYRACVIAKRNQLNPSSIYSVWVNPGTTIFIIREWLAIIKDVWIG